MSSCQVSQRWAAACLHDLDRRRAVLLEVQPNLATEHQFPRGESREALGAHGEICGYDIRFRGGVGVARLLLGLPSKRKGRKPPRELKKDSGSGATRFVVARGVSIAVKPDREVGWLVARPCPDARLQ